MDARQKTLKARVAVWLAVWLAAVCAAPIAAPLAGPVAALPRRAPARIISVVPAVTEMLFAMGAGPQVVGVGSYDHFPPEADRLPKVGALLDPDFEKILSMRPDLVIVYGTQTDFIARLERASIPTFPYEHAGLPDITTTIRRLGERVGRAHEADALASGIERDLGAIRARTAPLPRIRTLLIFGREPGSLRGVYASGGVGFLHDLLAVAGGTDVFEDLKRQSVVISAEQIIARAPDAIIELYEDSADDTRLAAEKKVWQQLPSLPAVRNNRIYLLRGDFLTVPGPRIVLAARLLADALHPQ